MGLVKILTPLALAICAYYFYSRENISEGTVRGKRVLVTGSSTGIGEQIAYEFARMGAHVMVTARREKKLQGVVKKCLELGASSAWYTMADMGNLTFAQAVAEEAARKLGGLDYLVLNHVGGAVHFGPFAGDMEGVISSMSVNFLSYIQVTVSALKMLEASHGGIIVISSVSGRLPAPFQTSYAAAKFALEGFYSGFRTEMRLRKIDLAITIATLGYIDTETAMREVGGKISMAPSSKEDCAREVVKGGVLRQREVIYPYWPLKLILLLRDWFPEQIDDLLGKSYKLDKILPA